VLGGALISPQISGVLLSMDIPVFDTGIDRPSEAAMIVIGVFYIVAALFNIYIPDTGVRYERQPSNPLVLTRDFGICLVTLWRDKLGQISLAVTTLFWGAGATLQFIVLRWADSHLGMPLDKAAILQGITAVGIAFGAVLAAQIIPLKKSLSVLPAGILMGIVVMTMTLVDYLPVVYALLIVIGTLAGFFVVPMNALLQHRGHVLLSAGHSIAVQNFNENISILVMLALYSAMIGVHLHIDIIILIFGSFVSMVMYVIIRLHKSNQAKQDSLHLIGMEKKQPVAGH